MEKSKIFELNRWDDETIYLNDDTRIYFCHEQDCCEEVYADLTALEDTGFATDTTITKETLQIEIVEGYGIRLNGYGIPCYNNQNGYYNSYITIYVNDEAIKTFDVDDFGKENQYYL